jgi:hypothetical protein
MESRGRIPLVFAQATERNERITSLLSSVFLRTVRSDYADATEHAFPSSIERLEYARKSVSVNNPTRSQARARVPVVLFIKQERDHNMHRDGIFTTTATSGTSRTHTLLQSIQQAVGRTAVACAELSVTGPPNDDTRSFRRFLEVLHPETPLFIVESSVTTLWVQAVLFEETSTDTRPNVNLRGMVTLHCAQQEQLPRLVGSIRSHVPHLVLVVTGESWLGVLRDDLCQVSRSNPNAITVSLPLSNQDEKQAQPRLHQPPNDESALSYCRSTRLWAARTVVKFVQAVTITDYDENSSSSSSGTDTNISVAVDTQSTRTELAMSADNPTTTQQRRTDLMACKLLASRL